MALLFGNKATRITVADDNDYNVLSVEQNSDTRKSSLVGTSLPSEPVTNKAVYQKTATQQNLQTTSPALNDQGPVTLRSLLGKIYEVGQTDPVQAQSMYERVLELQQDPSSELFNPYLNPTNKAIENLRNLGVNVDIIDDKWFDDNAYLMNYYETSNTTNNVKAPTKKSSTESRAAYWYNQMLDARDATQKAKTEFSAAMEEVAFLATLTDRNYSDDDIVNKVISDKTKYPTLAKMMSASQTGEPIELNEAVPFSTDALYAQAWAARNPDYTGDMQGAMINSYLGRNNVWKPNDDLAAKLDSGNRDTYSPYSVGSTMDEERTYFKRAGFDQKWIDENWSRYMGSSDETERKMFGKVVAAEEYTQKLEKQRTAMMADIDALTEQYYDSPEKVLAALKDGTNDYSDLFDLDKTLTNPAKGLKDTTRGVDYRWADIEKKVQEKCEQKRKRKTVSDVVSDTTGVPATDTEKALEGAKRSEMEDVGSTIRTSGTEGEKAAYVTGKVADFSAVAKALADATVSAGKVVKDTAAKVVTDFFDSLRTTGDYEQHEQALQDAQKGLDNISGELNGLRERRSEAGTLGSMTPEQYNTLMQVDMNAPAMSEIRSYLEENPNDAEALSAFYEIVTGSSPAVGVRSEQEYQGRLEQAKQWLNYADKNSQSPVDRIVADANRTGDDVDELELEEGNWTITLAKDDRGLFAFDKAVNAVTGKAYGADRQDEVDAALGFMTPNLLTAEEADRLDRLEAYEAQQLARIDQEKTYLELNESIYEDALADQKLMAECYNSVFGGQLGPSESGLISSLDHIYQAGRNYVPTNWTPYSVFEMAVQEGQMTQEKAQAWAAQASTGYLKEADKLQTDLLTLEQLGVPLTEEEKSNVQRQIADLRRDALSAAYLLLNDRPDFAEKAELGRLKQQEDHLDLSTMFDMAMKGVGENESKLSRISFNPLQALLGIKDVADTVTMGNLLSDEEWARFNYLYYEDGKDAAQKYLNMLLDPEYGVVTVRKSETLSEQVREYAGSDPGAAINATLMSFGTNLLSMPTALGYIVNQRLSGEEVNPYNRAFDFQNITGAARTGTRELIEEATGGSQFATMLYDGLTSSMDSLINGAVVTPVLSDISAMFGATKLGKLFTDIGNANNYLAENGSNWFTRFVGKSGKFLAKAGSDGLHAATMGLNSAASTYADVLRNHGTADQAAMMAVVNFFSETGSEAITFGNLHDSFVHGTSAEKGAFVQFVKDFFSNGGEEFFGEGINEWINKNADRVILGASSEYEKNVQKYMDQQIPETLARQMADRDMWKDILTAGATGFLSSAMGTVSSTVAGRGSRTGSAETVTEQNVNTEAPVTEQNDAFTQQRVNAETQEAVDINEEVPAEGAITEQRVNGNSENESAVEQAPVTEQPVNTADQQVAKDTSLLLNIDAGDPTSAAVATAAFLNTGDVDADKAASQSMLNTLGHGRPKTVARSLSGLLTTFRGMMQANQDLQYDDVKGAVAYAAVTEGEGRQALQKIFNKGARGMTITEQNVNDLLAGVANDQAADPENTAQENAIHDSRVDNRTVEIASTGENRTRIRAAEATAQDARDTVNRAQEGLDEAQSDLDEAQGAVERAVESLQQDPGNDDLLGPVEQAANHLKGQTTVVEQRQAEVDKAQEQADKAEAELTQTRNEVMTESRAQAVLDIEQQDVERAAALQEQQAAVPSVVPLPRAFPAKTGNGRTVQITGVLMASDQAPYTVYSTPDGYITEGELRGRRQTGVLSVIDGMIDANTQSPVNPYMWLGHSLRAVDAAGNTMDMIGIAGQNQNDTVLMSADGKLYLLDDLTLEEDPFTGAEGDQSFFDMTEDLDYDSLPEIAEEEIVHDTGEGEQGSESNALPVEQTGDQPGQLPVETGSDVGSGDNVYAGSDGGEGNDGRYAESPTGSDGSAVRGVPPRLLNRNITKTLKTKGVTDMKLQAEQDPQRFSSALDAAKANNTHGAYVDAQSVESLQEKGAVMILSQNGLAGAAVGTQGNEAGNIFGVFKNGRSRARNASASLIIQAVDQGGNKLDCYHGGLSRLYSRVGMIPVARVTFNEEFMPESWNVERDDHPDIVFWMHNGDSAETVAQKYGLREEEGGYHVYTNDEIQALPLFDDVGEGDNTEYGYDRAWAYRDEMLAQRIAATQTGVNGQTEEAPSTQNDVNGNIQALRVNTQSQTPTQQQAEKMRAKLKSPQQIAHNLVSNLGFGNYLGTRNFGQLGREVRGFWDRHSHGLAVRNRDIGKYTHTMHEVGHGVAQALGLTGTNLATDDMIDSMIRDTPSFEQLYSRDELRGEAFAEFMWRYMESEQRARDFAGDAFYDSFERRLAANPRMQASIGESRAELQQWINASDSEQFQSRIRWERKNGRQTFKQAVRTVINELADSSSIAEDVNAFIRNATGQKDLDMRNDLRATANLANHSQKVAIQNLTDSLTSADRTVIGDGLGKRLSDAGFEGTEANVHLLEEYALLKHSLYRDAEAKTVFGEQTTLEQRERRIKEIESTRPDIVRAEQAWQGFRHDFLQAWMVDTGYWSQEFLDHLEEMYPHYVPTFRVRNEDADNISQMTGFGRKAKKFSLHEATGGSEDIYSPYYSFIGMVDQIVGMVDTNRIAQTFDRLYQENEGMGIFGQMVPEGEAITKIEPNPNTLNSRQKQLLDLLGDTVSEDVMEKALKIAASKPGVNQDTGNDGLLHVQREDGTIVRYEITNPELYKLLTGAQASSGIRVLQAVGALTRTMSMLTTGSNPLFAVRNAVRDFQNSVNYGSWASNYLTGAMKWARTFMEVWRGQSDAFRDYKALGGGGWTRIDQNSTKSMQAIQEEMFGADKSNVGKTAKWLGKKIWEKITMEHLNEVIEQTSRFAEYKYGKHDLSTAEGRQKAFLAAQDATVDFSRSGNSEAAYVLKKLIPFFNASMQGVYRTGREFTEAERSRLVPRLTKTIVNTALMSALASGLILKFGDDDDKEEFMMLSDGVKANHLILPNPLKGQEGQPPFLRIPLSQDPLTYAVHSIVTNGMMNGSDDEMAITLAATADVILDNLNPLGSGTIAQPFIDVSHNRTWYGSNIVRTAQLDWDPASQYNEDTPEVFKTLGRLLNASPEVIEYLAQQYTGFLGTMAIPALSVEKNGNVGGVDALLQSIIKKWTADPASSSDMTSSFYDMKKILSNITDEAQADRPQNILLRSLTQEQVNAAHDEAEDMLKNGGIVYETSKLITNTYKEIDKINGNETLTDAQKFDLTREAKMKMLKQVELVNEQLEAYRKKYIVGETLTDRVFGAIRKRFEEGAYAHIRTDAERLPEVFRNDSDSDYMQKAQQVWQETGKASALPHPSQTFTVTKNGVETDYEIPDEEWDAYTRIYRDEYSLYLSRKGTRWDTMTLTEQQNLLKNAHSAANKAMREAYISNSGTR